MAEHTISDGQAARFAALMCEELGLDPAKVAEISADSNGLVDVRFRMDPDRVVELFNTSAEVST